MFVATILVTSLRAVGTLAVLAGAGAYLRHLGVMAPQVSRGLSEVSMCLTIPCLLFTTAMDCTQNWSRRPCPGLVTELQQGWPMLLLPFLYVSVGSLVGLAAAKIGRAAADFRRSVVVAVAFGNSTGLPVTLLAVIHSSFSAKTSLGAVNPLLFLSIYLVFYPVLQWSMGSWLLRPRPVESPPSPVRSFDTLSSYTSVLSEAASLLLKPEEPIAAPADQPPWVPPHRSRRSDVLLVLRRVFPPPVIAAILGVICAVVGPVRGLLVDTHNREDAAPLEWIFDGLQKIGAAAVPVNMFILGSSLAAGAQRGAVSFRTAAAVAFAKMVVMPCVGLLLALGLKALHAVKDGPADAFYLVAMVVTATPTANNIMVMAELAGENKEGLSACIFLQYLLAPLLLTLWLAVFVFVATSKNLTLAA